MNSTASVIDHFFRALRTALDAGDMDAADSALSSLGMYSEGWTDEQEASYRQLYATHRDRYVEAGSFNWGHAQMREAHDKAFTRKPAA